MYIDNIKHLPSGHIGVLEMLCKWGCDVTTGEAFEQMFQDDNGTKSDVNVIVILIVPMQLFSQTSIDRYILWKNLRPSFPRYCRPIKIEFTHETPEKTKVAVECMQEQEKKLQPTVPLGLCMRTI